MFVSYFFLLFLADIFYYSLCIMKRFISILVFISSPVSHCKARYLQRMAKRQRKQALRKRQQQGQHQAEPLSHSGPRSPSHSPPSHVLVSSSDIEGPSLGSSGGLSRAVSRNAVLSSPPRVRELSRSPSTNGAVVKFRGGVQSSPVESSQQQQQSTQQDQQPVTLAGSGMIVPTGTPNGTADNVELALNTSLGLTLDSWGI
jgi:hypothetical protein